MKAMAMALEYPLNTETYLSNAAGAGVQASAVKFSIYERGNSTSNSRIGGIFLHMPLQFENPMKVDWQSKPFDLMGSSNEVGSVPSMGNMFERSKRAAQSGISSLTSAGLSSSVSGSDVTEYTSGKINNPYIKLLFKGLDFRSFTMMFNFLPKNADESNIIHEIIKEFRKAALPEQSGSLMTYPREVGIEYISAGGASNKWLNKFKRCVITDLNVNYTGAGFYNAMSDGFPAQTLLKMTFTENELVFRRDVDAGY